MLCLLFCGIYGQSTKQKIKDMIFQNYNSSVPPESAQQHPVKLALEFLIKSFVVEDGYYASNYETLKTKGLFQMTWTDERLKWNPSEFSSERSVILDKSELWHPSFGLDTTFDDLSVTCTGTSCIVRSDGMVSCIPHCTFPATCIDNAQRWPYGILTCTLLLGRWNHIDTDVSIASFDTAVITDLEKFNKYWRMLSISSELTEIRSQLHGKKFPLIRVSFLVERISSFYAIAIVVPAISMLTCNLLPLWLPINSSMRYMILLVILHAHFSFIQQLSWRLPKNGEQTPLLLNYFRDSIIMTTFLIVFITITKRLSMKQCPVPRWIDLVVNTIGSQPLLAAILPSPLDASTCMSMKPYAETVADDANLVHSDRPDAMVIASIYQWQRIALILERICFITTTVVYAVMLFCFIPLGNERPEHVVAPVQQIWKQ
ncbi:5-hydroxytryptamine receptor 3A-like [Topomyia yanbarensis]|uniref:5-hydroxytryptamine receptor 3A-like n=1 Tax=Topomyia yanbarensis TaxID=2498891 RepID=UPI00273B6F2B|nr:5-hydroxytryptamine receptor 3A-like [Topomyia yanbarensis]